MAKHAAILWHERFYRFWQGRSHGTPLLLITLSLIRCFGWIFFKFWAFFRFERIFLFWAILFCFARFFLFWAIFPCFGRFFLCFELFFFSWPIFFWAIFFCFGRFIFPVLRNFYCFYGIFSCFERFFFFWGGGGIFSVLGDFSVWGNFFSNVFPHLFTWWRAKWSTRAADYIIVYLWSPSGLFVAQKWL